MAESTARIRGLFVALGATVLFAGWWTLRGGGSPKTVADDVALVQEAWGSLGDSGERHAVTPLCRASAVEGEPNGRSVLVVTVSTPKVARAAVADSGGSGAVVVERVAPAGASSSQALASIFGGAFPLGVDPGAFVLPPHVDGLPAALLDHGYETIGAARVDLTFGNRRAALRGLGFRRFIEPRGEEPFDVVARVTEALTTVRAETPERPFFAWAHAPDPGPILRWYREHEAGKGTLLVLTALRADVDADDWTTPVMLEGKGLDAPEDVAGRLGSHTDISATLRDLLGMAPGQCEQGISLLGESWPDDRVVATFGVRGESLRMFEGDEAWTVPGADVPGDVTRFAEAFRRVATASSSELALGVTKRHLPIRPPVSAPTAPLVIAHRGNIDGPRPDGAANRAKDFEAAIAAGFDWIELDVGITKDDELAVMHNQFVANGRVLTWIRDLTLAELRAQPGHDHVQTLDTVVAAYEERAGLLVDIKPSLDPAKDQALAEALALRAQAAGGRRLYQSFSHEITAYLAHACEPCVVGWLTPPETALDERAIEAARLHRFDFLSVRHDLVDARFIDQARAAGVRVFIYGVNDVEALERFGASVPDGVITDHRRLLEADWTSAGVLR